MQDLPEPRADAAKESRETPDASEDIRPWWRRSPPYAAGAALAIGLATLWFGNMMGRVPLDAQSSFSYLLMLPLLLIVPAFSLAAMRLSWLALTTPSVQRSVIAAVALAAMLANALAIVRLADALWRIFTH